jgi:predicted O-methyltransferase YrrM
MKKNGMNVKNRLRLISDKSIRFIQRRWTNNDLEIFLRSSLAGSPELPGINDPVAYVANLRKSIEPLTFDIASVKGDESKGSDGPSLRFSNLIQKLRHDTPPIPFPMARTIAGYADGFLGNYAPFESGNYATDVADFFRISSSAGEKARLLAAVVRFMRPKACLELGTCYGMSAVIIMSMLRATGEFRSFDTVERSDRLYPIAKEKLAGQFGELITCSKGSVQEALPGILATREQIDFVFHDAGHAREDYINDFNMMEPHLSSGAVIVLDDLHWNEPHDPRFSASPPRAYEGWKEILKHGRVKRAVEINKSVGLILID